LSPVIHAYGGRRVKTIGDAFLVVFDSATRAIACGAALQDRLADYNQRVPETEQINVRVAINTGEVRVEGGDVFGETVNIASRVEGVAEAGEVCFTEATLLLSDAASVPRDDLGEHTLKGIPDPIHLFRLSRADGPKPYLGAALDPLGLPSPAPEELARYRAPLPLAKRALAMTVVLLVLGFGVRWAGVGRWFAAPAPTMAKVELLADQGRLDDARFSYLELKKAGAPPAELACLDGVLLEAEGKRAQAIKRYAACGELNRSLAQTHAGDRLVRMLDDESCDVRAQSARTLGKLKVAAAVAPLTRISEKEPKRTGLFDGMFGGCYSGDDARAALAHLTD
jgi:hypothetical protein